MPPTNARDITLRYSRPVWPQLRAWVRRSHLLRSCVVQRDLGISVIMYPLTQDYVGSFARSIDANEDETRDRREFIN